MSTVRCSDRRGGGGLYLPGGVPAQGDGCVSQHALRQTPPPPPREQNDR